jgi:zinc D-Ala-D-Ala dipeptidase
VFQEIHPSAQLLVDLRYGGTNNFVGKNMYGDYGTVFLHETAAVKLHKAEALLAQENKSWKLLILDALRPRAVQRVLWDRVKGTPQEIYVVDPEKGSNHNFGFAVDLTLADEHGRELDMGTLFDSFEERAQPRHEERLLSSGALKEDQVARRRVLRRVMESAGFIQLPHEWWHYDALPREEVRARFSIVE